jgi:hypothetical protein
MRLAVIDPAYVPAAAGLPMVNPKVTFEGEEVLDDRPYAVLDGYVPAAGDRVLMIPTGTTYTIVGRIAGAAAQQGHSGQNLIVPGIITAGPRSIQIPEIQVGKHTATMAVAAAAYTSAVIPFPTAWPVGVVPVMPSPNIESASGTENYLYARARNITNTGFQITVFKSDAARADFTLASIVIHWVAYYKP